jgi:hypothetical protein
MPNPYDWDVITGADPSGQARMLADMLRRKQAVGELTGLVGGKSFSPWGENLARSAGGELSQLARLAEVRQEQARRQAADAEARRQWEAEMEFKNRALNQEKWSAYTDPFTGASALYNKRTGEKRVEPSGGGQYVKPLTDTQATAAMFLAQAQGQLGQAMGAGRDVLPRTGLGGLKEQAAWEARRMGFPQLSTDKEMARQSMLLAIAEPIVRAESGAAVPESEVKRLAVRYVPQPGESRVEQYRKLQSLVVAISSVMQKLPPAKAEEFRPFYEQATEWARELATTDTARPQPTTGVAPPPREALDTPQTRQFRAARERANKYYEEQ